MIIQSYNQKDECLYCPQGASCMGTLDNLWQHLPSIAFKGTWICVVGGECRAGQRFILRGKRI